VPVAIPLLPIVLIAAAAAAAPAPATGTSVVFADSALVDGQDVRLGEMADLSALPVELRARAAGVVVLRFAPGQWSVRTPVRRLAERARGQLPILAHWLPRDDARMVTVRRIFSPVAASAQTGPCMRLTAPLAAGASPRAADLEPAPCGARVTPRAFYFDRGFARASHNLEAGTTVAALPTSAVAGVRPGDAILLFARVGPVAIERRVTAVQAAGAGQPVFVRGEDGEVFSAMPEGEGPR